jgi:hypothetical protein
MAISQFSELKTAIGTWLARTDLSTVAGDFVALCESDIRRDLRLQAQETLATGTLTGETLAHPTRYLEARRLTVGGYLYEYVTPQKYGEITKAESTANVFTSIGTDLYINDGASGDDYTLLYYAGFAPFSADADTNWLLTNHPDVYLFGSLKYGAMYLADDQATAKFAGLYNAAVERVGRRDYRAARPGTLRMIAG